MLKSIIIKFLMGGIAIGIGVWYLSSSIGGDSITYTSLDKFLTAIGVQNGDIASANGCFLCGYVEKMFHTIALSTENFWNAMLDSIWVLLGIGFGIFLFYHTAEYLYTESKKNAKLDESERKLEFKPWFDKVRSQGIRIMIVGAFLGAIGLGGTYTLRAVSNITIAPVMFVGSQLSMAATGISDSAKCGTQNISDDVLNPVLKPFMCTIGNLNTVMLSGAASGFSLMNYSWMGMGGGMFTWLAGLVLVIGFLIIGFNLFFEIFSIIFKLIFLIIFLPLIVASAAFKETWKLGSSIIPNSIGMLVSSAIGIVRVSLKIMLVWATVSYAADRYFPGPVDGYNAILPQILKPGKSINPDNQTMSVISVFSKCEQVATVNGEMDKDIFKTCFIKNKSEIEGKYPGAFDFMADGFDFMLMMLGLFFLYFYLLSKKIDEILGGKEKHEFDFGKWVKEFGVTVWNGPSKLITRFTKKS